MASSSASTIGRIAAGAVERHFDGEHVGIAGRDAQEIDHRLKRFKRMMQQDVALLDHREHLRPAGEIESGGNRRNKGLVLQRWAVETHHGLQAAEIDGPIDAVDILLAELQIRGQQFNQLRGHAAIDLHANHVAETAAPDGFLDAFQQIVCFQFLNRKFGVASDMEERRVENLHLRKKRAEIVDDHLFQPNEGDLAGVGRNLDQLGQRIGHLDPGEPLNAVAVRNHRSHVQTEVGDVRERPAGIDGQRCQHRIDDASKVVVQKRLLRRVQFSQIDDANGVLDESRQQMVAIERIHVLKQLIHFLPDEFEDFAGAFSVLADFVVAALNLLPEAGDAHHEKLVHVGADDGEELQRVRSAGWRNRRLLREPGAGKPGD